MGFFNKKERAAKKAYRNIVKQKTTLAARQAYADEAVKVAAERARQKARRPSLFGVAKGKLREKAEEVVSGKRRYSPVKRRRVARKTTKRRTAKRRYAPVKRRTIARRVVRRTVQKASAPTVPTTLNQAIYG